jgi:hypothetical protein
MWPYFDILKIIFGIKCFIKCKVNFTLCKWMKKFINEEFVSNNIIKTRLLVCLNVFPSGSGDSSCLWIWALGQFESRNADVILCCWLCPDLKTLATTEHNHQDAVRKPWEEAHIERTQKTIPTYSHVKAPFWMCILHTIESPPLLTPGWRHVNWP